MCISKWMCEFGWKSMDGLSVLIMNPHLGCMALNAGKYRANQKVSLVLQRYEFYDVGVATQESKELWMK